MSTLLLNGLMPDRHWRFIQRLGERHTLCGPLVDRLADRLPGPTIGFEENADYRNTPGAADLIRRLEDETRNLAESLAADVRHSPALARENWQADPAFVQQTLRPRVAQALIQDLQFRTFVDRHPVDLVISGSDFAAHARVMARAARRAGIRTLDIEHGFFFNHITPEYARYHGKMPLLFASEFVNLDSELEADLIRHDYDHFHPGHCRFLGLGTPIDTVASEGRDRDEACALLGLDPARPQILFCGSWNEARTVQKVLRSQVETIAMYEDLFRRLAGHPLGAQAQLTLKLHPADALPHVFPGVKAGFEELAARCGLPTPRVLADRLPEAVSSADVVLTMGYSSVLYDAFLLRKPTVVVFPPFLVHSDRPDWKTRSSMPLRAGVSVAVTSGQEAWQRVAEFLEPARRARFLADHETFTTSYGLGLRPVDLKCDRILEWIEA